MHALPGEECNFNLSISPVLLNCAWHGGGRDSVSKSNDKLIPMQGGIMSPGKYKREGVATHYPLTKHIERWIPHSSTKHLNMVCTFVTLQEGNPSATCGHAGNKHTKMKKADGRYAVWCSLCPSKPPCAGTLTVGQVSNLTEKKSEQVPFWGMTQDEPVLISTFQLTCSTCGGVRRG